LKGGEVRGWGTVRRNPTNEKPPIDGMEKFELDRSPQKLNNKNGAGGYKTRMLPF
jgi:hypothetical protein